MKEKEIILDINGKDYTVKIHSFTATEAEISVENKTYKVGLKDLGVEQVAEVKPQPAPRGPQSTAPSTSAAKPSASVVHRPSSIADGSSVIAPLPGLITKVFVNEGDNITVGQPIMMLEAMKMENEVTSTANGMIIDIRCKEGDSVNQGDPLILLKAAEA